MSECWNDEKCKYPEEIGLSVCSDCKNRIIYELEKNNEELISKFLLDAKNDNLLNSVMYEKLKYRIKFY